MSFKYCFSPECRVPRRKKPSTSPKTPKTPKTPKKRTKPKPKRKSKHPKKRKSIKRKSIKRPKKRQSCASPKKAKKKIQRPKKIKKAKQVVYRKSSPRRRKQKSIVRKARTRKAKSVKSKLITETKHETWICDPDTGICKLVYEDRTKGTTKAKRYLGPLIPVKDANLLELATGLDGKIYCAVADPINALGQKWVKCGKKGTEKCGC